MNYHQNHQKVMLKSVLITFLAVLVCAYSFAQSPGYQEDKAKVFETIKSNASKNSYNYVITYDNVANTAMFVKPNKSYRVFYVYDISPRVATNFLAYLMNSDKEVQKKYSAKPADVGVVGSARVARLEFSTKNFAADKLSVKIEANPNATIYIFEK